jgi:DNA (cytosine-5)-methyltransferase 1
VADELLIGSLCSGYGGLDLAVEDVFPQARLAWYAQWEPPDRKTKNPDANQYAAQIMAHHWPGVPNIGNIAAVDYSKVQRVHILTAGFPCQPVSDAGKKLGVEDDRWLWPEIARAVGELRPRLVLLENVAALLRRGLEIVLADLAALGFDAEWECIRASDIGAPHPRSRLFVLAWPADADPLGR